MPQARALPRSPPSSPFREIGVFDCVAYEDERPHTHDDRGTPRSRGTDVHVASDREDRRGCLSGSDVISGGEGDNLDSTPSTRDDPHRSTNSCSRWTDCSQNPRSAPRYHSCSGSGECGSEDSAASGLISECHSAVGLSFMSNAMYQCSGIPSPRDAEMTTAYSDSNTKAGDWQQRLDPRGNGAGEITAHRSTARTPLLTPGTQPPQRSRRHQPASTSSQSVTSPRCASPTTVPPRDFPRRSPFGLVAARGCESTAMAACTAQLRGGEGAADNRTGSETRVHVRGSGTQSERVLTPSSLHTHDSSEGGRVSNVSMPVDVSQQTQPSNTQRATQSVFMTNGNSLGAGGDISHMEEERECQTRDAQGNWGSGVVGARAGIGVRALPGLRHRRPRERSRERATTLLTDEAAAGSLRGPGGPQSRRPVMSWSSRARVCALESAPSGELFTGGDPSGAIEVWDSRIGRRLGALRGHRAAVLSLRMLPHSALLLSGSADCTARLWDVQTLQTKMLLKGHRGLITALETLWMPNVGLHLFTGSDDGTVRQWHAVTGACLHVYQGHRGPVNVVTSLMPAKYIATGGSDGLFKVWNAQTLRCLSSIPAVPSRASSGALVAHESRARRRGTGVGVAPGASDWTDQGTALSSSGSVWDIAQLNDNNQSLATATDDGVVRLWATQWNRHAVLLKEICIPDMLLKGRTRARCLLACGAHLFVGGARGELYVWYTEELPYVSGDTHSSVDAPRSWWWGAGLHPGVAPTTTTTAAAAAAATTTIIISTEKMETYRATFLFHTAALTGLSRRGAHLCSASLDHTVCRWDLRQLVPLSDDAEDATAMVRTGAGCNGDLYKAVGNGGEVGGPLCGRGSPQGISRGLRSGGSMTDGGIVDAMPLTYPGASFLPTGVTSQSSSTLFGGVGGVDESSGAPWIQQNGFGVAGAVAELNAAEAAAVYPQLPLSFVVRHLRAAATSPVELRSLLRTVLLLVYAILLVLLFVLGLAPVSQHSVDIAAGMLSLTANHPLPSFARPQTFRSIRNSADMVLWLTLLMEQLHSFQVPVQLALSHKLNTTSAVQRGLLRHLLKPRGRAVTTWKDVGTRAGSEYATTAGSTDANTLRPSAIAANSSSISSASSDSTASTAGRRKGHIDAPVDVVRLPAMPGGVVVLSNVRVRAKHVTNASCAWNPHLLHRHRMLTTATTNPAATGQDARFVYACYGTLGASTTATDPLCVAEALSTSTGGEPVNATGNTTAPLVCLPYMSKGAGVPFHGLAGSYDSGGYAVDLAVGLPHSRGPWVSEDLQVLLKYQAQFMDDRRTRLVDVLLYTYHIHSHTFVQLHYSLERPVSGVWLPTTIARSFSVYGADTVPHVRTTLACTVIVFLLLLCLLGLALYDMMLAYRMRALMTHCTSLTVVLNLILIASGLCVVACTFHWMSLSMELEMAQLVQSLTSVRTKNVSGTSSGASFASLMAPPVVHAVLSQLSDVEFAFRCVTTSTAAHAILFFQEITMLFWRLTTFLQVMRVVLQQIRLPLLVGLALIVLSVTGVSLAFEALYGSTQFHYRSPSKALVHVWLYLCTCQTLSDDVSSPLSEERQNTGRLLLLLVNYIVRLFFLAYVVVLVWECFQATSLFIPAIPPRARLAKWWLDISYQFALMSQASTATPVSLTLPSRSASTPTQSLQPQQHRQGGLPSNTAENAPRTGRNEGGGGRSSRQPSAVVVSEAPNPPAASRVSLCSYGNHASLVEYLLKHLRLLQKQRECTRPRWTGKRSVDEETDGRSLGSTRASHSPLQSGCRQDGGGGGPLAAWDAMPSATPIGIDTTGSRGCISFTESRRGDRGCHKAFTPTPDSVFPVSAAGDGTVTGGDAPCFDDSVAYPAHLQVRQTDLLLCLPKDARTPFARGVIQHTWNSLTWMYHYDQQHIRTHDLTVRDRIFRLDQGIQQTQERFAFLNGVVRAAQARMADHEARLRPLAKAVAAVSGRP